MNGIYTQTAQKKINGILENMKVVLVAASMAAMAVVFSACDDEEKPKMIPTVATGEVTEITTSSAVAGGEIVDNGNAEITESGLVYSSIVGEPTIADDRIMLTTTTGSFTSLLEGLKSGTKYNVRAYATNSVGTGYGEIINFTTGNSAPVTSNVVITGTPEVNKQVTASYTYNDSEGDAESGSTLQWYAATDAAGAGETAIAGATQLTYVIAPAYQGKYLRFGVTPKAATGNTTGTEVKSAFIGAVGEATTLTFLYNGVQVTYGIITSTVTNRKWLDRSLGAPNTPTAFDDFANYGDMFQWGRAADGHQLITRTGNTNDLTTAVNEPETTTLATSDTPGHAFFIRNSAIPLDWRNPRNGNLWQGVSGINNPCPEGWRIPTRAEWEAEGLTTISLAFGQLKLTTSGVRSASTGNFSDVGTSARFWTSTIVPSASTPTTTYRITVTTAGTTFNSDFRANGNACRCIKD